MAYAAELDENNIVLRVLKISDEQTHRVQDHLAVDLKLGGTWIQTSYNTVGGTHTLGGTPLRKNFAGQGFIYDSVRDAFIPPKPFESWVLNEDTCTWDAPVARPEGEDPYIWDEPTVSWVKVDLPESPE